MSLSPDQVELRKLGITATDVAAITGHHPWRSPIDVFLEKKGAKPPFVGNDATEWGELLEPLIRNDYAKRHNARVEVPGTLMHPVHEWRRATPDGIVYLDHGTNPDRGLEIKVHNERAMRALRYGDPGTDDVPLHELIQSAWGMSTTSLPRWDLCVFNGTPTDYIIDRDEELIEMLNERAERFLVDNIRANVAPPPDGTKSYDAWISSRFNAENSKGAMLPVDKEDPILVQVAALKETRAALDQLEKTEATLEQALKLRIGDAAGLELPGRLKLTYKRPKDSIETDYEAVVTELRNAAQIVVQAKGSEIARSMTVLDKFADEQFANTRATISATEIRAVIGLLSETLTAIAKAHSIAVNTKVVPNARRMLVPSQWKAKTK